MNTGGFADTFHIFECGIWLAVGDIFIMFRETATYLAVPWQMHGADCRLVTFVMSFPSIVIFPLSIS